MEPFVTLNHFSLPLWIHDPIAARDAFSRVLWDDPAPQGFGPSGWIGDDIVPEFAKYSAYLAWKFGDLVDTWTPINEPMVVAVTGYVNLGPGPKFPPAAFSFPAVLAAVQNMLRANAAAYDEIHRWDTVDANGDGKAAQVGLVQNMIAFTPADPNKPNDVLGTKHANYIFNEMFINGAVRGDIDSNVDSVITPAERHPELAGKADFIGVNYYFRGRITGLGYSFSTTIPLFDFSPSTGYRTPQSPSLPVCPTECSDFGSEIYVEGFRKVLDIAGGYGLPVYITENGIADADDDQRPGFLIKHLAVLHKAIADGAADVRGYFYWSLMDNFEWSAGYYPKFGLYSYDPETLERTARPSARIYRDISHKNGIPADLLQRYGG